MEHARQRGSGLRRGWTQVPLALQAEPGPGGWPAVEPGLHLLRWHHREAGAVDGGGTPVVLLHGLGMSSLSLVPLLRRAGRQGRVLAPDAPGSGRSAPPPRPLRLDEQAAALVSWLDAVGLRRVVLVGHSYGGQLAVATALRAPDRVERLVLAGATRDPAAPTPLRQALRLLADARRERPGILLLALLDYLRTGPRRMLAVLRHVLGQPEELQLAAVGVPALVAWGTRDPVSPEPWARRLVSLLPDGRLAVVPGGTHGMVFSQPDAFWAAVRDFCTASPTPAGG
ncbi:hypothetical protein NUM3379_31310 [Kineococcus sp. NUM-3379]